MSAPIAAATLTREEFNRRAVIALRAADLDEMSWDHHFVHNIGKHVDYRCSLTDAQQQKLYEVVIRHRGKTWDRLIVEYARQHVEATR